MYVHLTYIEITTIVTPKSGMEMVKEYKQAPGPIPWPIIGNLSLLLRFEVPFEGFTELSKELGDIYSLTIGSVRCLVVNNLDLIKEVLNQNGKFFGGRPDFLRYHKLFGGDPLALCDWSPLQQKRRNLARIHCSPRNTSSHFKRMSDIGCLEINELMIKLKSTNEIIKGEELDIKPILQQTCANMFSHYMCSIRFDYDDKDFQKVVEYFDEIFWEINQSCVYDFFPLLAPFFRKHITTITKWSTFIRRFILERIIRDRECNADMEGAENDFTDVILKSLTESENVTRDTILYMLEDFIGGHSAVGNLVLIALGHVAKNPFIGERIKQETDQISISAHRKINLYDMDKMPYTMATIFEVLRYSSSPIVPHVATEDAIVSGYGVTKGTIVFINNFKLNTSSQLWKSPDIFNPERFLEQTSDKESKTNFNRGNPDSLNQSDMETEENSLNKKNMNKNIHLKTNIPHFLPFSIGRRTCIGQNLLRSFAFILLANILQHYQVHSKDLSAIKTKPACVALPLLNYLRERERESKKERESAYNRKILRVIKKFDLFKDQPRKITMACFVKCFNCKRSLKTLSECPNCQQFLPYFEESQKSEIILNEIKAEVKSCESEIEELCQDLNGIESDCMLLQEGYAILQNEAKALQMDLLICSNDLEALEVKQLQTKNDSLFESQRVTTSKVNQILNSKLNYVPRELENQFFKSKKLSNEDKNLQSLVNQIDDLKLEIGIKRLPVNALKTTKHQDKNLNKMNRSKKINEFADNYLYACDKKKSEVGDNYFGNVSERKKQVMEIRDKNSKTVMILNNRKRVSKLIQEKTKTNAFDNNI
uniref:Cytochrome P450 n=1 Tax=Glossina brevipalpis TaxID=37001 RepID=A0A1A9WV93_9MUSC